MGFPASASANHVRETLGAPDRALQERLDQDPGRIRYRLEVQIDGGGRRGLERAARRLGFTPDALLDLARREVDPDVPLDVLPVEAA